MSDYKPTGPEGLRILAAWFDKTDASRGVTDNEIQADLRRWADEMLLAQLQLGAIRDLLDSLLENSVAGGPPISDGEVIEKIAKIMSHSEVGGYIRNEIRAHIDRVMFGEGGGFEITGILPE